MDIEQIKLQFERLERHNKQSLANKDVIAFLDLAHVLRIFTDMKKEVDSKISELGFSPDFTNTIKNKELSQILSGSEYFSLPISSGVESPDVQIKGMTMVQRALTADEVKRLFEAGPPVSTTTKLSFVNWLGASIVERGTPESSGQAKIPISREIFIKRVANILGASHPAGMEHGTELENRYDPYIKELHLMQVANGYPLTYYQLLEISSEIIRVFTPVFK